MTVIECAVVTLMAMAFVASMFLLRSLEKLLVKGAKCIEEQAAINADFDKRLRGHWANIVELKRDRKQAAGEVKADEGVKNGE